MTIETFAVGDSIDWGNDVSTKWVKSNAEEKGHLTPFTVTKVIPVSVRKCTCGSQNESHLPAPHCELNEPNYVGHHQWIEVLDRDGKQVVCKIKRGGENPKKEEPSRYSGAYFAKIL